MPASMRVTAAAPSLMLEALPGVTVPSGRNAGFSLPRFSRVASARGDSSRSKRIVPDFALSSMGTICEVNRPASMAAMARRWRATACQSWACREMLKRCAIFSAVMPMWPLSNGSVMDATSASMAVASFRRAPHRSAGIQ